MRHLIDRRHRGGWLRPVALLTGLWAFPPAVAQEWSRVRVETQADLTAAHFATPLDGYVAGTFGTLLRTVDGGGTWTSVATPVGASFVSVAATSPGEVFIGRTGLYHSANGGQDWDIDVGGFESFSGSIFDIVFPSPGHGFFTKGGGLFATTDGGAHWDLVQATELFLDDIQHAGGDVLFATGGISYSEVFGLTSRGDIARSIDGGATWETIERPEINEIHASVWYGAHAGIVFTFTNKSHRTEDLGQSWEVVSEAMQTTEGAPLPAIIMDAVLDSRNNIVAVDFAGNFLESPDGAVWQLTPGSGEPLVAMTRLPDGAIIAVGNAGNIWKRTSPDAPPPLPLAITAIRLDPAKGQVLLDATGTPGTTYQVSMSPDLSEWIGVSTVTPETSGFSVAVDTPRDRGHAYFRLHELPKPVPR